MTAFVAKHVRNRPQDPLDEDTHRSVYETYFADDVARLEALVGRDLSCWREWEL